ncbi:MAG: sugar ABC transporter substrate-binding protein [Clostridia bacterium]|nr:sugar ABC transporter substrate-binding protein [Clostridia bacterium]
MKKLLSLCMALAMLLTVLVPAAVAEEVTFGYNNYRVGAYSLDILQKNFEYAAKAMGIKVMVVNDEAKIDNCPINVDNMIAAEVKAVAFFGLNDNVMVSIAQRCEQAGVYFAFYDHMPSDQVVEMLKNFQYYAGAAATSDISTGRVAGEYAASTGAKKAVIVTGEQTDPSHSARVQGFTEAFEEAGGEVLGIGWGSPALSDSLTRANDLLTAHPEADFVYGSNGDCGLAAKEAIASHNGVNAKVYATDLDPDILTGLSDGTISAANGAHWINVYFAAALLANAVNGNVLKDADGNAPRLVVPVMTLPSSYIELYNRLWIENAPFTEEELAALVGPDVTLETLQAQLDNYTIDQRLDALVAAGRVTQEEVDAARSAAE